MSHERINRRIKEQDAIEDLLEGLNLKGLKLVHSYIKIMYRHVNKIYTLKGESLNE